MYVDTILSCILIILNARNLQSFLHSFRLISAYFANVQQNKVKFHCFRKDNYIFQSVQLPKKIIYFSGPVYGRWFHWQNIDECPCLWSPNFSWLQSEDRAWLKNGNEYERLITTASPMKVKKQNGFFILNARVFKHACKLRITCSYICGHICLCLALFSAFDRAPH